MNELLRGMSVMACATIGLFFLSFWRKSGDRLFVFFAACFWLLGLNWFLLTFVSSDEMETRLYFVRLVAFLLILLGIFDKNRKNASQSLMDATPTSGAQNEME